MAISRLKKGAVGRPCSASISPPIMSPIISPMPAIPWASGVAEAAVAGAAVTGTAGLPSG